MSVSSSATKAQVDKYAEAIRGFAASNPGWATAGAALDPLHAGALAAATLLFRPRMDKDAEWQEPKAHRSWKSGPVLAATAMERLDHVVDGGEHLYVTFLSFARSGAHIGASKPAPGDLLGKDGQLEEVRRTVGTRRIDALLISVGGNDVGFAGKLEDLVKRDIGVWPLWGKDAEARRDIFQSASDRIEALYVDDGDGPERARGPYKALADAIATTLRPFPRRVYITEYPVGLFEKRKDGRVVDGGPCGVFSAPDMDLDIDDGRTVKELGLQLNRKIAEAARALHWTYIGGIAKRFAGHGFCSDDTFFVGATESCSNQGDFEGMMHPNSKGHAAYAAEIRRVVEELMIDEPPRDGAGQPELPQGMSVVRRPPDLPSN